LQSLLAAFVFLSLFMAYAGSYYRLSRRGVAEAKKYELPGFLYVSADEVFAAKDLTKHYQRRVFYEPANWIDRKFFGGPGPVLSIIFDLTYRL
jgi:hypothetical protein